MRENCHVVAGECSATSESPEGSETHRGDVVAVCKPDNTLLVHDADGYQPVAWLTRPASLSVHDDRIEARDGDRRLIVTVHDQHGRASYPTDRAGTPVGDCPDCGGRLVSRAREVACLSCSRRHSVPGDATVGVSDCEDCGLPRLTVERGREFTVCLDPECESLDEQVREVLDGEWACPNCGDDLRVLRRGGLILGCDAYPACETGFSLPAGTFVGDCECGLPVVETATTRRCLNTDCARS